MDKKLQYIKSLYPNAKCELHYQTLFQLLIAVVLSAQTTDVRVNQVTANLFKKYPDAKTLKNAPLDEIEMLIKAIGMYKVKAKNIIQIAKDIDDYDLFDYNMFPRMVINSKGEIVFDNLGLSFSPFQSDKFPLDDIEKVEKYISKFGDALFYFINDTVFKKAENIINILDLILDNMKKNEIDVKKDKNDRKFYNDIIGQILHRKIKFCKNLNNKLCQLIFDRINKIFWTENRIEKSLYKQDVYKILHIEI